MIINLEPKRLQIAAMTCSDRVSRDFLTCVTVVGGPKGTTYYSTNGLAALRQKSHVTCEQEFQIFINRFDAELIGRLRLAAVAYYKQGEYWMSNTSGAPTFTGNKGLDQDGHERAYSIKTPLSCSPADYNFELLELFARVGKKLKCINSLRILQYGSDCRGEVVFPEETGCDGLIMPVRSKT